MARLCDRCGEPGTKRHPVRLRKYGPGGKDGSIYLDGSCWTAFLVERARRIAADWKPILESIERRENEKVLNMVYVSEAPLAKIQWTCGCGELRYVWGGNYAGPAQPLVLFFRAIEEALTPCPRFQDGPGFMDRGVA